MPATFSLALTRDLSRFDEPVVYSATFVLDVPCERAMGICPAKVGHDSHHFQCPAVVILRRAMLMGQHRAGNHQQTDHYGQSEYDQHTFRFFTRSSDQ